MREPLILTRAMPAQRAKVRKDSADSIRALSALLVVFSHAIQIIWLPVYGLGTYIHRINSFVSETAVIVFFVLSGFLISASIDSNIDRNSGRFNIFDYSISRVMRILPPLLFAALLSVSLFLFMIAFRLPGIERPLLAHGDLYSARDIVSVTVADIWNTLTMSNGLLVMNGPLWSLYVEVKLYAIAGLAAYMAGGRLPLILRGILISFVLWLAGVWGLTFAQPHWFYCCWWLLGAAFYVAGRHQRNLRYAGIAGIVATAAVALGLSPIGAGIEVTRILSICGLSLLMFYVWSWNEPITRKIAGYSYTLYLIHFPILIFAYAVLVSLSGDAAPSLSARAATALIGVAVALSCSLHAARRLEDTASIRIGLMAVLGRAQRPA